MNRIIRWYNQNRQMIWTAILISVGVITLIQALNNYYKNNPKPESSSTNFSTTTYNKPNYAVVTQEEINETLNEDSTEIIEKFFDYCNTGKVEEAYNLLSEDCKKELYPTVDRFKQKYYNKIFTEKKMYNSVLWIANGSKNTYRLEIIGDILATGKKETMPIEEYYTTIYNNGDYKLSINSFIGKEELNILNAEKDITINVLNKKIYIDYEKYEIKVKNNTSRNIIFNSKETTDSVFVQDENGTKYIAFLNEIADSELKLSPGYIATYNIRFNRSYRPTISLEKISFGNIKMGDKSENKTIEVLLSK